MQTLKGRVSLLLIFATALFGQGERGTLNGTVADPSGAVVVGAAVKATVDDKAVVLSGTVETERQHALALRIAESYAGERGIKDKITIRGTT